VLNAQRCNSESEFAKKLTPVDFGVENFPRLGFFPCEMSLDFTLDRHARYERSAGLRTETTEAV
jgi:hypothetical protein